MRNQILSAGCTRLDYAEVVSLDTLQPISRLEGPIMLATAAFFAKTRLIDNVRLRIEGGKLIEPHSVE